MDAPSAFTSRLSGLMLSVTPENVLTIRDTLQTEVQRLRLDYNMHNQAASTLSVLGPDPISTQASAAFDPKLQAVVAQFKTVIDEVQSTVDVLTATAHSYGLVEGDIGSTMHGIGSDTSGARLLVTCLVSEQPAAPFPDVPGLAASTPAVLPASQNPTPNGFDAVYVRSVLNPDTQVGMSRP